jgi:hypothetical protein
MREECFLDKAKEGKIVGASLGAGLIGQAEIVQLQNHYSGRLNKCFVEMDDTASRLAGP